eukprot:2098564-Amphidinium_carterae.1
MKGIQFSVSQPAFARSQDQTICTKCFEELEYITSDPALGLRCMSHSMSNERPLPRSDVLQNLIAATSLLPTRNQLSLEICPTVAMCTKCAD